MLIQNWLVLSSKRDKEDSALMWKILPPVWKMLLTFRGGWDWDLLRWAPNLVCSPPPHTNLTSLYDKKNQLVIKTKWFSGIGVCSVTGFQYWFQFQQINLCRRRRVSAVTGVRDSRQKASYRLIWRLIPSFTTQYAAAKKTEAVCQDVVSSKLISKSPCQIFVNIFPLLGPRCEMTM